MSYHPCLDTIHVEAASFSGVHVADTDPVNPKDRIAQLILERISVPILKQVDVSGRDATSLRRFHTPAP
jgi:hypothetical protein